jgi:thioredoxin 1
MGFYMMKEEDNELESIKKQKFEEILKRISRKTEEMKPAQVVSSKPLDLTDATFTNFVQSKAIAVVDVWAPWCGPCRFVSPILEAIAKDYAGKISFGKLNVDQNKIVASQFGIMSIPTLLVFKKGQLVDRIIGAMPRQKLEPRITRFL